MTFTIVGIPRARRSEPSRRTNRRSLATNLAASPCSAARSNVVFPTPSAPR
jgi:hypothetical protein